MPTITDDCARCGYEADWTVEDISARRNCPRCNTENHVWVPTRSTHLPGEGISEKKRQRVEEAMVGITR